MLTHSAAGLGTVNGIQCKKVSWSNRLIYHCSRDTQVHAREASNFAGVRMARTGGRLGVGWADTNEGVESAKWHHLQALNFGRAVGGTFPIRDIYLQRAGLWLSSRG